MERYIGLDAHGTSCTFGVIGPSGRKLRQDVIETSGAALVSYVRGIPGRKHLCLEEGTQSAWLYEILSPHVVEIVVASITESRGQKSDMLDAFRRAEELRTGTVKKPVFKAPAREAMKIGRAIRALEIHTQAPMLGSDGNPDCETGFSTIPVPRDSSNCNLASAGFFIHIGGFSRGGTYLAIHRPTFSGKEYGKLDEDTAEQAFTSPLVRIDPPVLARSGPPLDREL